MSAAINSSPHNATYVALCRTVRAAFSSSVTAWSSRDLFSVTHMKKRRPVLTLMKHPRNVENWQSARSARE